MSDAGLSDSIDRIAPSCRPGLPVVGYQEWRSLLFLHWTVPSDVLRPLVPASLQLDLWEGHAYVGVVPFCMRGVRPHWCPRAGGFNFLETNLRTYVVGGGQPGVYFFSLDANSRIAVQAARWGWGLPYFFADMHTRRDADRIEYMSRRQRDAAHLHVKYRTNDPQYPSVPGSIEHFLLERYLLFVQRRGGLYMGQVHHQPYPATRVEVLSVSESLLTAAGLPSASGPPVLAHYSAGVDVEIFPLQRQG